MNLSEAEVKELVGKVISQLDPTSIQPSTREEELGQGVFQTIDEAIAAATVAEQKMNATSLVTREKMIQEMRATSIAHAGELAKLTVDETGLGRAEDKTEKNLLAANKTPGIEDLPSINYSGDDGVTMVENAPMGIFGSITPTTNPVATMINNSISLVAAGNVVVYNPHPGAKKVTNKMMRLLNEAIVSVGGPENVLTSIANPTIETSGEVMNHPDIRALVVTGGSGVVKAAMGTGKKVIAAGPGNPPAVVDDTADIDKAAKDIVLGASFDNNVLCTSEKQIFVVEKVARALKTAMKKHHAIELSGFQLDKLLKVILIEDQGKFMPNKDFIGKDASILLEAAGIKADPETRLIFTETAVDHPLVSTEMLMPIIPVVKTGCVNQAIRYAVESEKGNRHTAVMHSQNITHLTDMAKAIQTTILVSNGSSLAGLGFEGEGYTTMTIAGPTGEGLTSAKTFTRQRRNAVVKGLRMF